MKLWTGCLLVLSVGVAAEAMNFPQPRWGPYSYKTQLSDNYFLFWTPNRQSNEITIEIQAATKGFVGLGLGTGSGMIGADIAVGWVKDGKGFLQDMHAVVNGMPLLDTQQDWKLLNSEENDVFTVLRFSRRFDTGDCKDDRAITADTMDIIWSYGVTDELQYHGNNRGKTVLQLLDNSQPVQQNTLPADTLTFEFRLPNVTIPANKTTLYWCHVFALPPLTKKHHIIQHSRILDLSTVVHHIIAYGCYHRITDPSLYNTGTECYSPEMPPELYNCREVTMGWAVGGDEFVNLPNAAGISLGTSDDVTFFMFEIHYNNKDGKDLVDHSALKIWYTPTLRQHDVGTLAVGHDVAATEIIPPRSLYTVTGICHSECTKKHITEPGGLHVFSYFLHAHLLGRQIRVRRIRNGTQIDWFGKDEAYDFAYQQFRLFSNETLLLPGDMLIAECGLDSSERDTVTFGGLSTYNEMCLAFFNYYPRMKMVWCLSSVSPQLQATIFDVNVQVADNGTVLSPANYRGEQYTSLFSSARWNADLVDRLQKLQKTQPHSITCLYFNNSLANADFMTLPYPNYTQLSIQDSICSRKEQQAFASTAPTRNRLSMLHLIFIIILATIVPTITHPSS